MTIADKVHKACMRYMQNNMTSPNELIIGEAERFELEQYIKSQRLLTIRDMSLKIKKSEKMEFMGLKVRFNKWAQSSSFLEVDYNPHYD